MAREPTELRALVGMSRANVYECPREAARVLSDLPNVAVDHVLVWRQGVEFDLTFEPPDELAAAGYGRESARLVVPRKGDPEATPRGPRRPWKHRNPRRGDSDDRWTTGTMCLYDPLDPRALRWEWDDGLEQYVLRLQRHLFFEEFNRREGHWPVEDAPHGHSGHEPHPIRSRLMKEAVAAWTASRTG